MDVSSLRRDVKKVRRRKEQDISNSREGRKKDEEEKIVKQERILGLY